jgi:O-antigen/teichoic acid export membrane protein
MKLNSFSEIKSLFFDNRSIKQTIFKNTFWLGLAEAVSRFLTFILFIYVAKILGATEYGKFSYALAIMYIFNIFQGLVSPQIITREISQDKEKEKEFPAIISFNIVLGLGATALMALSSFFITPDPGLRKIIWILAFYNFATSFFTIVWAFLRARERMEYESLMKIIQAALLTGFGFAAILFFPSVERLSYAYFFAALGSVGLSLIFFHFRVFPLSINWDRRIWKKIFLLSWPLALVSVFSTLYNQMDSFMMGYWGQITQTGLYNAAYKIIFTALIPITLVSTSFYPVLSRAFKESKEKFQKIWDYQMEIMIFLAFPLVVGGMVLSSRIIDFIYDPSYFPSIFAFQILIFMVGIIFLANVFQQALIVANQQKKIFFVVALGAAANFILNLVLIPVCSLYGAAIATVITNILIILVLVRMTLKHTSINPFNLRIFGSFVSAGVSSVAMYFLISRPFILGLNPVFSVLIGAAIYFLCLFLVKLVQGQIINK